MMYSTAVVIPTFNKARYLALTLASLVNQTFSDFHTIVVDDGSVDDTRETVDRYIGRLSLTYVYQPNAGRSAARNAALRCCTTAHTVLFCDDDRLLPPEYLEQHLAAMGNAERIVVVGRKRSVLSWWEPDVLPLAHRQLTLLSSRHGRALGGLAGLPLTQLITESDLLTRWDESIGQWDLGEEADNFPSAQVDTSGAVQAPLSWLYVTTANLSIRSPKLGKSIFFDDRYAGWGVEDTDLGYQLFSDGIPIKFEPSILNFHQIHATGPGGAAANDSARRTQLAHNFARFCFKWGDLEPYLVAAAYGRLTAEEMHQLAVEAAAHKGTLLVNELKQLYAKMLEAMVDTTPTSTEGQA